MFKLVFILIIGLMIGYSLQQVDIDLGGDEESAGDIAGNLTGRLPLFERPPGGFGLDDDEDLVVNGTFVGDLF